MPGNLTIVGMGPARPEHLTAGARGCLERARSTGARAYGLAHVREIAGSVEPELEVRSLDWLYGVQGVDRPRAYRDLADLLIRRAFDDGFDVYYLVAGSPLFVNDAVLVSRRSAARHRTPKTAARTHASETENMCPRAPELRLPGPAMPRSLSRA